jgi:phospholipid/cholesterol/gamma-HCH transport system substrate-binding protein
VKISFVPVGMVTDSKRRDDGSSEVTLKLYGDAKDRLGTEPSALIRPTTLLGGNYFVDLVPGGQKGRFEGEIPKERSHIPVELDKIARALQPNALAGMKGTLDKLDTTLQTGSKEALQRLFKDSPDALRPTGQVVDALRGTNPTKDLTDVVSGLEHTAQELANPRGRLDSIINDLAVTSAVFGRRSGDFAATLDALPGALHSADKGLRRLNVTLDVLNDTVDHIRPEAQELYHTLKRIDPVLHKARPVVRDLRDVLEEARPLVQQLVPDVRDLDDTLDNLRGPVLDRVNGPVSDLILNKYRGSGPYAQTSTDKPIFQELAYALANLDRATMQTRNGSAIAFQPWLFGGEPTEGIVQNDGRPRGETLLGTATGPVQINPPIRRTPSRPARCCPCWVASRVRKESDDRPANPLAAGARGPRVRACQDRAGSGPQHDRGDRADRDRRDRRRDHPGQPAVRRPLGRPVDVLRGLRVHAGHQPR